MTEKLHTTHPSYAKPLLIAVVVVLLLVEAWCGYQVHGLSEKRKEYKMDYAFVNNVSFGLLSVDVWRDQVIAAASGEIGEFKLTPEQENDMRKQIDATLHGLVDQAFQDINKKQKSIGGKLKKLAVNIMVDPKEVHAEVPGFTKKLMAEITKPSSYKRIANIADTAIAQIGRKIYDSSFMGSRLVMDSIYRKYGATDKAGFERANAIRVAGVKDACWQYAYYMFGAVGAIVLLLVLLRKKDYLHASLSVLSVAAALILLTVGVTSTIIEIDATLEKLDLHLVSKAVSFSNQDLFFQSQSILKVISLLIQSGRVDSLIVGMMILIFAVLFPLVKLVSIALCTLSPDKWARNKNIYYFAFEADKWDMSNVMVVAILMTFIGFNGIVNSTLESLNFSDGSISSATANNTSIQPGYLIFIVFVVFVFVVTATLFKKRYPVKSRPAVDREPDMVNA
jgi:hypothetical protein